MMDVIKKKPKNTQLNQTSAVGQRESGIAGGIGTGINSGLANMQGYGATQATNGGTVMGMQQAQAGAH